MSKIVYLAYYSGEKHNREVSPAAEVVVRYVLDSLKDVQSDVVLISPAQSTSNECLPREEHNFGNKTAIFVPTIRRAKRYNLFYRWVQKSRRERILLKELKQQLEDGDTLIVYHSLSLMKTVQKIKKQKRINLVLQVCEIYSDVLQKATLRKRELSFFEIADKYIFQTDLLKNCLSVDNKPYIVLHGAYLLPDLCGKPFLDGRVHIVYAGTFDPRKGGAAAAAAAAQFLSNRYHVHILGFGTKEETENLLTTIENVSKKTECIVTYDGLKSGMDYIQFMQSCAIGLSTQNPDASFNATSFPSKILSYMANGLRVVSIRIPAIEQSAIGKNMYYYDKQTPQKIAEAIQSVDLNEEYDGRKIIRELDERFSRELKDLLSL